MSAAAIAALSPQQADAIRQMLRNAGKLTELVAFNKARIMGLASRMTQAYR